MRVLAIGAHPDDVEILCGGTLAKYAARGDQVTIMIATNGNVGSPVLSQEEIAAVRRNEAEASAACIGADLIWLGYDDEFLFHTRETRLVFINAIRKAAPDVMFVHGNNDYHPDHRICGEIAVDCRIPVTVPLIETEYPPMARIPHVFVMDNLGGIGFEPEFYVDISDVYERKNSMIRAHASQDQWLQYQYGMDYIEFVSKTSAMRGMAIGVQHAEAFRSLPMYPVMGGASLLP
ncbi:PIG-L deacetylase family protein [Paenibacillus ginsengihumi]|uniref:PIG-L deacetylase family protein n=1 Tax=Paenibacillus ginsengihumi TaxID=431596 RepID=UPI0003643D18|nr:PIG-L deacetylase family protein [Paenibacillus ginsengihumi]